MLKLRLRRDIDVAVGYFDMGIGAVLKRPRGNAGVTAPPLPGSLVAALQLGKRLAVRGCLKIWIDGVQISILQLTGQK